MQNIDYSRRLRSTPTTGPSYPHTPSASFSSEIPRFRSPLFLVVGAILLFTSGMVVGIQMKQKEQFFQDSQERSFANVGKKSPKKETKEPSPANLEENRDSGSQGLGLGSVLKYPPKNDQINYMVQIGDFSPEEAVSMGKKLVQSGESLSGRIFRTSTGKLYAGYFYRMEDAKEALEQIQKVAPEAQNAALKTIRF